MQNCHRFVAIMDFILFKVYFIAFFEFSVCRNLWSLLASSGYYRNHSLHASEYYRNPRSYITKLYIHLYITGLYIHLYIHLYITKQLYIYMLLEIYIYQRDQFNQQPWTHAFIVETQKKVYRDPDPVELALLMIIN